MTLIVLGGSLPPGNGLLMPVLGLNHPLPFPATVPSVTMGAQLFIDLYIARADSGSRECTPCSP